MTPAATRLVFDLLRERTNAAQEADGDEMNTFTRLAFTARRDALDWAIAAVRKALPDIERDAMDEERGTAEWLEAGAGIGDGPDLYERLPDVAA